MASFSEEKPASGAPDIITLDVAEKTETGTGSGLPCSKLESIFPRGEWFSLPGKRQGTMRAAVAAGSATAIGSSDFESVTIGLLDALRDAQSPLAAARSKNQRVSGERVERLRRVPAVRES